MPKVSATFKPQQKSVTLREERTPLTGNPPLFRTDHDAVLYAYAQGIFQDMAAAEQQLAELRAEHGPHCWAIWLGILANRAKVLNRTYSRQNTGYSGNF